jgi:His-Xaa-Ser system protein HxsD
MKRIKFSLNCQIFPLEAVYATCYNFIDRVYIYLDKKGDNILISLKPREESKINPRIFEGEFRNELLHNTLRMKISQNNAKIREYIISQAVCSSLALPTEKAQESEQEKSYSYVEDPLGIAIPWEEKMKMQQEKSKKPVVKKARKKPPKKISKKKSKK